MGITMYPQAHIVPRPPKAYLVGWSVGRWFFIDDIYEVGYHEGGLPWDVFRERCVKLGIDVPDELYAMMDEE